MSAVLATYTLQVFSRESEPAEEGTAYQRAEEDTAVLKALPAFVAEAQENLIDLLPEGYSVVIREWDAEEEPA